MIHYFLYFFLICHLFASECCEALQGEIVLPADVHEFPFIASLGRKSSDNPNIRTHYCTGSLVTSQHVLTAAHCVKGENMRQVDVIIDRADLTKSTPRYDVSSWVTYEEWTFRNGITLEFATHEIAVVTLSALIMDIKPVALTKLNDRQLHRTKAVIAGYGENAEGMETLWLQKANVTIMTAEACKCRVLSSFDTEMRELLSIEENYLCSSADPFVLTTDGDSGGPLLDENNVLVGITRGLCPEERWGDFPQEFYNKYLVNFALSVNLYREFIVNETKEATRH